MTWSPRRLDRIDLYEAAKLPVATGSRGSISGVALPSANRPKALLLQGLNSWRIRRRPFVNSEGRRELRASNTNN
jgi:hypothetical protein